jgi:hypothetical protein
MVRFWGGPFDGQETEFDGAAIFVHPDNALLLDYQLVSGIYERDPNDYDRMVWRQAPKSEEG